MCFTSFPFTLHVAYFLIAPERLHCADRQPLFSQSLIDWLEQREVIFLSVAGLCSAWSWADDFIDFHGPVIVQTFLYVDVFDRYRYMVKDSVSFFLFQYIYQLYSNFLTTTTLFSDPPRLGEFIDFYDPQSAQKF